MPRPEVHPEPSADGCVCGIGVGQSSTLALLPAHSRAASPRNLSQERAFGSAPFRSDAPETISVLSQISRIHAVHVREGLVFPGHAPDELVIALAAAGMDGPGQMNL